MVKFTYKNTDELRQDIAALGLDLPVSDDLSILKTPVNKIPNRLAVNPMEGADSQPDGTPSELVTRRYERFATGGSGLLWVEACSVCHEGRANPRQLYMHKGNVESLAQLAKDCAENSKKAIGDSAYSVLQLTHSGRYAKPGAPLGAVIPQENEHLDKFLPPVHKIVTDQELAELEDMFVDSAVMAHQAGYNAVDIKTCHRYLISELLSSTRPGIYGGSFENRTRLLLNVIDKINAKLDGKIDITLRINAYDQIPGGFGMDENGQIDLTEICTLAQILHKKGVKMINITGGNPYYNPHINRPYDAGGYTAQEHQLIGVHRLLNAARQVKKAVPEMCVVASGFTWLREFGANVAAGCIEQGWFDVAGFGRQAFAYPDFAKDILEKGAMERKKTCICCSKCTTIMRDGGTTGCVIRDSEVYMPIYKAGREGKPEFFSDKVAEHI